MAGLRTGEEHRLVAAGQLRAQRRGDHGGGDADVSLFFVMVYAHLSIRRTIASGQIFYIECFFLITYAVLLVVPINAFRRVLEVPHPLLEYRPGLVMKVLY